MPVSRETLLTLDEATLARDIARERYNLMLADFDYREEPADTACDRAAQEKVLAVVAWRQAVTLVLTGRVILETGVSG